MTFPPRIPFLPHVAPLRKKDKSKQFLVEQLLPSEDEKQPPSPLVQFTKTLPTVPLPPQPLEFVNGGYGMKNPLVTGSTPYRDETTTTAAASGDQGQYSCRICGKWSSHATLQEPLKPLEPMRGADHLPIRANGASSVFKQL
nr:Protein ovo [Haemonchus contortus]